MGNYKRLEYGNTYSDILPAISRFVEDKDKYIIIDNFAGIMDVLESKEDISDTTSAEYVYTYNEVIYMIVEKGSYHDEKKIPLSKLMIYTTDSVIWRSTEMPYRVDIIAYVVDDISRIPYSVNKDGYKYNYKNNFLAFFERIGQIADKYNKIYDNMQNTFYKLDRGLFPELGGALTHCERNILKDLNAEIDTAIRGYFPNFEMPIFDRSVYTNKIIIHDDI
jgi:hypothetical protein